MKKLIVIALVLFGLTNYAQEKNEKGEKSKMEQMSPEQKSQLQLKKMTLALDLNETQQKEMSPIISEMKANRETHKASMKAMKEKGEKPTADERFEMQNKMLDNQIAMKKRIAKILTTKQLEKWEEMQQSKGKHSKKVMYDKPDKKEE